MGVGLALISGGFVIGGRSRLTNLLTNYRIPPRAQRVNVDDQREIVRAIAVWTENLRDAISASSGLEQAISSTAAYAPVAIEAPLQRLVGSMKYQPAEDCLRDFADALANPTSDFVIAALIVSMKHPTRDFSSLLSHLSDCARAECDLYMRIWVSRARSRTSRRVITVSVIAFSAGLAVFNPNYLRPFATANGFVFLVGICGCFASGLIWLHHISTLPAAQRFLHVEEIA